MNKIEAAKAKTSTFEKLNYVKYPDYADSPRDYLGLGHPFIITDAFEKSASENDILETIKKKLGNKIIAIRTNDYKTPEIYSAIRTSEQKTVSEYIDFLYSDPASEYYAANNILTKKDIKNLKLLNPISNGSSEHPRIWIGNQNSLTPLHRDSTDNFSCQLFGQKKWTIFSIHDNDNLYFLENSFGKLLNKKSEFSTSLVDIRKADKAKYPLFANAIPIEIMVNPFEILYLPYGWGHFVQNISISIMVNFWYKLESYTPNVLR